MFDLINKYSERYERYAGISIGIIIDSGIYIDAVGKGFDGREVSKGIVIHEGYFIPWMQINRCGLENFHDYKVYQIGKEEYEKSRDERIRFLLSIGYDIKDVEKHISKNYELIPSFIWKDIIDNIIKKLPKMEDELSSLGFYDFTINGHTEGKRFLPWQMYDSSRCNFHLNKLNRKILH